MGTERDYQKIQEITACYRKRLLQIPEDKFIQRPTFGGWSCSEVYFHIFDASMLSMDAMTAAAMGAGKDRKTHFLVKLVLFADMLPPGKKFKAPAMLEQRLRTVTKAEAFDMLTGFLQGLEKVYHLLSDASSHSKTRHPVMGYLNAKAWLRFIEIHLNHHLKQLKRIMDSLDI